ncbi:hypothetical protein BDK51DRAFT_28199 [Blyttiomyces helicus]|uniref:Homeobox domain-containing protein n=1 Tax=Blyttiomyces helicus TaxID=388810 RepID=A0A4P9WHY5_9FUNG|nr:hypothetical protein BDK51DRAFT_28199 [Blyttiomyces helicus]|eukprot:RKO92012.1 hypothetical protein BDK51DRAFT_28199 [Blyttiomyces helicus]
MPRKAAKTELSKFHGIEPVVLTKWFQSRRNKDKAALKKQAIINEKNDDQNQKEKKNVKINDTMTNQEDEGEKNLNSQDLIMKATNDDVALKLVPDQIDSVKDTQLATNDIKINDQKESTSKNTTKVSKSSSKNFNKGESVKNVSDKVEPLQNEQVATKDDKKKKKNNDQKQSSSKKSTTKVPKSASRNSKGV